MTEERKARDETTAERDLRVARDMVSAHNLARGGAGNPPEWCEADEEAVRNLATAFADARWQGVIAERARQDAVEGGW